MTKPTIDRTNSLRAVVKNMLLQQCDNVFYERAPDMSEFPYVVFTIKNVDFPYIKRTDYDIDIDVWHNTGTSFSAIERLCDVIEKDIDGVSVITDVICVTFLMRSFMRLEEEKRELQHRRMYVRCNVYDV